MGLFEALSIQPSAILMTGGKKLALPNKPAKDSRLRMEGDPELPNAAIRFHTLEKMVIVEILSNYELLQDRSDACIISRLVLIRRLPVDPRAHFWMQPKSSTECFMWSTTWLEQEKPPCPNCIPYMRFSCILSQLPTLIPNLALDENAIELFGTPTPQATGGRQ